MKEQIIQLPDDFEVKEVKDCKIILVEKEKKLTYDDIAKRLFDEPYFYISAMGEIETSSLIKYATDLNNCTSKRQGQKLLAINKLMNVAKYLNDGWQPDWSNDAQIKYFIVGKHENLDITIRMTSRYQPSFVYFKNTELIAKAIEILGEETIKLALCSDY